MSRPNIALCVIARDEERFIADCLDSARPFVDEMIVLDTGSLDRTREIAGEHGARVVEFTWIHDFAAARNAAIEAATAEWIFMLDADERLAPESGTVLRAMPGRMPAGTHAACPRIESRALDNSGGYNIAGQVPRFFRRAPDVRWVGAIHEDLVYLPQPAATRSVVVDDLRVVHYGYDPEVYAERHKDERNTELLERQVREHPDDPRALYFLAQQHHAMRRHSQALPYLRSFLDTAATVRREFTVEAHVMLLTALLAEGRYAELEATARAAEEANLLCPAAYEVLANYEALRGQPGRAREYLERALSGQLPQGVTYERGTGGWGTRLRLAELLESLGQRQEALSQLDLAYRELPEDARATVSSQALALALRAYAPGAAETWLERMRGDTSPDVDAQRDLLDLALRVHATSARPSPDPVERAILAEDWQAAYDACLSLAPGEPAGFVRVLRVAHEIRERGAADASLNLLDRALDAAPDRPEVYWELMQTLTVLGRIEDAQIALEAVEGLVNRAA
jgi:tetratricopeptide (TPR) repeat protein